MSETKTKKFEDIRDPGIRAFLIEGEALYPAGAVNFTMAEQRAFYDGSCARFRRPPAFLVAARLDPLHDDCFDYASRLHAAGVPAEVRDEPLLVHAFIRARNMSVAARASFNAITAACASLAHHGRLPQRTS